MLKWISELFRKGKKRRCARFTCYKDARNEWRFRLVGANNEIIISSEGYSSKQGCLKSIKLVKEISRHAPIENIRRA
jgi:hypothetical protein